MFNAELFIDAVRRRPALYNPNHQNYNKKEIRMRLWDEIGHIMFPNWANLDDREKLGKGLLMQRKWKSLRDCFKRELRLKRIPCSNSKRKQYEFYEKLSFLLIPNNLELSQQTFDVEEVEVKTEPPQDVEHINELSCNQSLPLEPPPNQQSWRKKKTDNVAVVRDARGKQNKSLDGEEDSDRLFLMSLVKDLSKLPLSTKYWVKMKFSEIMHQATINLEEQQKADHQGGPHQDMNGDIEFMS